jgi:hypothetical protein
MFLTVPEDLLHVHDRLVLLDVMALLPVVDKELVVDEEENDGADAGEHSAQHHLQPSFHLKQRKQLHNKSCTQGCGYVWYHRGTDPHPLPSYAREGR